jgi:hypothetical protein
VLKPPSNASYRIRERKRKDGIDCRSHRKHTLAVTKTKEPIKEKQKKDFKIVRETADCFYCRCGFQLELQ